MTEDTRRAATVADRLQAAAGDALVGRADEIAQLLTWLRPGEGPAVVFVHGIAGIGKTALVRTAAERCGQRALVIDGTEVEPVPAAFREAVTGGGEPPWPGGSGVVVVDGYEHLHILDGWLRNELLPSFPAGVTTLLVGRDGPNIAWRSSASWRSLLCELEVGPLPDDDARELLAARGIRADAVDRVLRFAHGHPLALSLAATAIVRHPDLDVPDGAPPEVVEQLVDVLFADLSPDEQQVVEAAALVRRPTAALLGAMTGASDATSAWRTLRDLSFTRLEPDGLRLDDVVKDTVAASLELRDPERARRLRRRAATAIAADVGAAPSWSVTADVLHLVHHPVIRRAFFPPGGIQHPVEAATRADDEAIVAIAARHEGAPAGEIARRWLRAHRRGAVVARGSGGAPVAFSIVAERSTVGTDVLDHDPVAAAWAAHLDRHPMADGDRALLIRWALAESSGVRPSPDLSAMWIDVKRTYLELRPSLQRVYAAVPDWRGLAPVMGPLGFAPIGAEVRVGERSFELVVLTFGAGSVDGWLQRLVEAELDASGPDGGGHDADSGTHALARLSAREREVLAALAGGLTNRELAGLLFISERTANRHVSNIFTKLGVHNRTAAARLAIDAGLVR